MANSKVPIAYSPRSDATSEAERSALAAVYKLCISSHAKNNAVGVTSTNGDDAKGSRDDLAKTIIRDG